MPQSYQLLYLAIVPVSLYDMQHNCSRRPLQEVQLQNWLSPGCCCPKGLVWCITNMGLCCIIKLVAACQLHGGKILSASRANCCKTAPSRSVCCAGQLVLQQTAASLVTAAAQCDARGLADVTRGLGQLHHAGCVIHDSDLQCITAQKKQLATFL